MNHYQIEICIRTKCGMKTLQSLRRFFPSPIEFIFCNLSFFLYKAKKKEN